MSGTRKSILNNIKILKNSMNSLLSGHVCIDYTPNCIIIIILVSVPKGTHDGRINREHVCVRVGERNEKEKKSLVIKVKFKKSSTRLNG